MGIWDRLFGRKPGAQTPPEAEPVRSAIEVGAKIETETDNFTTFNDRNITFTGELAGYDYTAILRDKQNVSNLYSMFQQSDYYVDAEPIYRGTIKNVYTPFSMDSEWRLVGANDKVRQKYEDYYERINLRDKMGSIFLQYYKYGQAYVYLMEDGNIITLPVHKCRISNMAVNGEPLVEFNVTSIRDEFQQSGIKAQKGFLDDDDLKNRLKGFPKEVIKALNDGAEYAQMDPNNCFVLQDFKEDWQRYAVPMIASFLPGLAKKALIGQYENALLNLGLRSFIHVTYGDPDNNMDLMPDATQLAQVRRIFSKAMSGSPLAVTNNWCKAETIQTDTRSLFEWDKYKEVNTELLSAGGISGIIVSGVSQEGSTFASAQVSIQTAVTRIKQAQKNFCEMMDKINLRLNGVEGGVSRSARSKIPRFTFMPLDLTGSKALQETCMKLWQQGVVSTQTLLDTHGYDMEQEYGRKKDEDAKGVTDVLSRSPEKPNEPAEPETDGEDGRGRPEMTDEERHSDPGNAERGKQPKPSNPEGSL